jgi:hypothetical protein
VSRQITLQVRAAGRSVDAATGAEQATYHASTVLDRRDFEIGQKIAGVLLGTKVRVAVDVTLNCARPRRTLAA